MDILNLTPKTNEIIKAATQNKRGWELICGADRDLKTAIYNELCGTYGPRGIQMALIGPSITITWESPAYADISELHAQLADDPEQQIDAA